MKIIVCVVCINNHMSYFQDKPRLQKLFSDIYPDEETQKGVMEAIKSNFSKNYRTSDFQDELTRILANYKTESDDFLTVDVLINELEENFKKGGRHSKKRATRHRRRSSKRKARKARTTRRKY